MQINSVNVSILQYLSPQASLTIKMNLMKAIRKYVLIKTIYDSEGFTSQNEKIKLNLETPRDYDFQNRDRSDPTQFTIDDYFLDLEINSIGTKQNIISNQISQNKKTQKQAQKNHNIISLLNITLDEILFNSNEEAKQEFIKDFEQQQGQLSLEKKEELFGKKKEAIYPFRNNSQNIDISSLVKNKLKKDYLIRAYRGDFDSLVELGWFEIFSGSKNKNKYQKKENFSSFINEKFFNQTLVSEGINEELALTYQFNDFIDKFHAIEHNRLIITSEYVIKSENINLEKLSQNWFESNEIFKKKNPNIQPLLLNHEKIIYPVTFVYIQRAPYLYYIYQQNDQINWKGIRLDRINDLKILDWNNSQIPCLLFELKENEELPDSRTIYEFLEYDKAFGYAFWKEKQWMILGFKRDHYEKYIKGTSREDYLEEITDFNYQSLKELIQRKSKYLIDDLNYLDLHPQKTINFGTEKLQELEYVVNNIIQSNPNNKYVFCLGKYYEGDSYILQRILAWGKQVKVVFPESLQDKIFKEIQPMLSLYRL